jgi:hypothetical protein
MFLQQERCCIKTSNSEGEAMMKKVLGNVLAVGMMIILLSGLCSAKTPATTVYAAELADGITIDDEYVIPDSIGWCTYYVLVATNNTGCDISISADFVAKDSSGNVIKKVNDYSDAVKKDQQFILYGQFNDKDIANAKSFEYTYTVNTTDKCAYSSVEVATKDEGEYVEVSATNYSEFDIQSVGVRSVFMKDGRAVAFDTVNIADAGITFHGGSTNSQVIGVTAGDYDNIILTYTSVSNHSITEDL